MSADKYCIRERDAGEVCRGEVTDVYLYAGCAETGGIGFHEMLSFRTLLESYHLKVGELEFRLDGNGTRAKTDVPERVAFP